MRYRLMASYQDAPFEAGIGPTEQDVVLFAACPPPEDLGFEPATGHWRKRVRIDDVQAIWESRPVGRFRGERCAILDDLGDRLHIGYLGHDGYKAEQLGYWQVDRGVFELVAPRGAVTQITEERTEYGRGTSSGRAAAPSAGWQPAPGPPPGPDWTAQSPAGPSGPSRWLPADEPSDAGEHPLGGDRRRPTGQSAPAAVPAPYRAAPDTVTGVMLPVAAGGPLPLEAEALRAASAARRPQRAGQGEAAPQRNGSPAAAPGRFGSRGAVSRQIFAELAEMAGIPSYRYAIGAATEGAICLLNSADGYQVFRLVNGERRELQTFATEDSACFYLFGILAAEAVRGGSLVRVPRP